MTSRLRTRAKQFALGALVAALGAGTYVIAAVVFSDFQSGTTISASEMNAKLNALKDAANAAEGSVSCPANTPTRFTDQGDGTVCDSQTGLMWEIKTGTAGGAQDLADPHNVNNTYTWSTLVVNPPTLPTQNQPDGTLYTDFLEKLNDLDGTQNDGTATPCFANHCDWRIPTIGELRSIIEAPFGPTSANCSSPCIAAGFPGSVQASFYWSSSSLASNPGIAWVVFFSNGFVSSVNKVFGSHARAVRSGR